MRRLHQPEGGQKYQHRGSPIADQRQGHANNRDQPHDHSDVDKDIKGKGDPYAHGDQTYLMRPGDSLFFVKIDSNSYSEENLVTKLTLDYRPTRANSKRR